MSATEKVAVETVVLDDLRPHPRNYRQHPDDQLEHIAHSLTEHGQYREVVVARDGTILAGHGVVLGARRLGWETVRVHRVDLAPDDPKAIKILAGDNEIGRLAEVDDRMLSDHLRALAELNELLGTGYDDQSLTNLVYVTRMEDEIPTLDHAAEWTGMPEFNGFDATGHVVMVHMDTEEDRDRFVAEIGVADFTRKERKVWSCKWPPRPREDKLSVKFEPGSG